VARTASARQRGGPGGRIAAWHAEALLRVHEQRPAAAVRAVHAGLSVLEDHRAVLGATELRARAGVHGEALARLGLRLALNRGDARGLLAAAERHRAQALQFPPVRPPVDPVLAGLLGELRHAAMRVDQARLGGEDTRAATAHVARLERSIVERARHADTWEAPHAFSAADLAGALDERALIELVEIDGDLHAVTLVDGRAQRHAVGTLADAEQQLESLRFALLRLVAGHGTARGRAAFATMRDTAAANLQAQLAPAFAATRGAPIVLVPTRSLHTLPWAVLPTLSDRPFSVVPSAALWQRAATSHASGMADRARDGANGHGRTLAVAGPDLAGAQAEAEAVAAAAGGGTVLTGAAASASATLAALDGCEHAHIAAHGTFRADNPLFSSLQLADGPLTVFDLETLTRAPRRIDLFACDAGIADVQPGDELMGLTAALLGLGTATVIASVLPLPDAAGLALAPQLVRRLAAGDRADEALAALRADEPGAAGLVCFGAG
ncbi:CHAT domain-containing protein, partial [Solirubrobacter phytolaccae]